MMAKMYKRSFLIKNNIEFQEGVAAQEALFTTEFFMLTENIAFIQETIFFYRIRKNESNPSDSESWGRS
ncbi:hypothetical protein QTG56_07410 [Rossellomorea sp. AcN35-11]|nr:hypothetical protein [Rossellomorea aquimaris]WJV30841.1 hypothetical protein QTG56_07410 [Rossellomorea sp. AcN35-11]